jgi:hypothetical protein
MFDAIKQFIKFSFDEVKLRSIMALFVGSLVCPILDSLAYLMKLKMPSLKKKKGGLHEKIK